MSESNLEVSVPEAPQVYTVLPAEGNNGLGDVATSNPESTDATDMQHVNAGSHVQNRSVDSEHTADLHGGAIVPNESLADPHRLAKIYRDERCRHADGISTLCFWQSGFLRWSGAYSPIAEPEIRAELTRTTKAEFDRLNREAIAAWLAAGRCNAAGDPCPPPFVFKVTRNLITDVHQALSGLSLLDGRIDHPSWLCANPPFPATETVPFANCLLNLPGWVDGTNAAPTAVAPTPAFFGLHMLDYNFNPEAPEPVEWLKFLRQLWDDDQESINLLQEFMGHLLVPDTSYQKILMMIGPRRSGRGTIARVVRSLIGPSNTCNPTLSSLATNFGLAPLVGKLAALVTDVRLSGRTDLAVVVENLLSISGEDARTIDRKYMQPLTTNLYARFVLISNEVPRLTDASGALASRMVLLKLTRSFLGHEDRTLTGRLLGELPGILLWATQGWKRLKERGHFIQPESGRAELDLLEDMSSPMSAFLKEKCLVGPEYSVPFTTLFHEWQAWCMINNRLPGDALRFGRDLHAVIPGLKVTQPRQDGTRARVYQGVGLQPVEIPKVVPARA